MSLLQYSIKNMIGGVSQQPGNIRLQNQCDEMVNCIPSVTDFLKRRPGTQHIAKLLESLPDNAFVDFIVRGEDEAGLLVITGGSARVYGLDGSYKGAVTNNYFSTVNPKEDLKLLTIKDYNFILNTKKTVSVGSGTKNMWNISMGRSLMGLIFIKQAAYDTEYSVTVNEKTFTYRTPKTDNGGLFILSTEVIAKGLVTGLIAGKENETYYVCPQYGEAHGIYSGPGPCWGFEMTKPGDGRCYAETVIKTGAISPLKDISVSSYKNMIFLKDERSVGQAKLTFSVDDSMNGSFIKALKDSTPYFTDLPLRAIHDYIISITGDFARESDDYYVKFIGDNTSKVISDGYWKECPKNDTYRYLTPETMPMAIKITSTGVTAECPPWAIQQAGDETSCPNPSFVGKTIRDIFFYRNRLCFLTEDTVCMSEAGEYFNFFNTTATVLLDSDPIDIAVSGTKVSPLCYAVPYNEGLFLYSGATLFVAEHGEVLSTANISIKPVIQFDTKLTARPVVIDTSIFYTTTRGGYTAIREYRPDSSGDLYGYSNDITNHVPAYIPDGIIKISSSMEESILLGIGGNNEVYVYKYMNGGNQERVQSAWGKWTFGGKVLYGDIIQGVLYLLISYTGDGVYLEKLGLSGIGNFKDRRGLSGKEIDFKSSYSYSTQYLRWEPVAPAVTGGRTQLRTLTVRYTDSGAFKIIIERRGREPEERIINAVGSGEARVALLANNEDTKIRIESIGANQFKLTESRFEAVFTSRSKII